MESPLHFEYSQEFKDIILDQLRRREGTPEHRRWFDMAMNRVAFQRAHFLPTLSRFVSLPGRKVLEIGCGTGPSTVVMAEQGAMVTAVDVDPKMVEAARLRVRDHGFSDAVKIIHAAGTETLGFPSGSFDIVVANGVFEHIRPQLRGSILREMWRVLRAGGCLFIGETPNRLWPGDDHTTGLFGLHYLPSPLAIRYAKFRKRIRPDDDLFSMGGLGCVYNKLVGALPRGEARVMNRKHEYSWLAYRKAANKETHGLNHIFLSAVLALLGAFESVILELIFNMPLDALMPYLSLCISKVVL